VGKAENSWELFTRLADGSLLPGTDCTRPVNEFTCQLGGPWTAPVEWTGLSTVSVRIGISCTNTSTTCAPGYYLHEAWTAIYRSTVTIDDPTPPMATDGGGSLFAGGYVRGNAAATVATASDGSGIRAVQVRVDGDRVVGETTLDCDYTRAKPCPDIASPVTVPVVTANIGDGTWTARVGVVDAGGNFTPATTQAITVDNGAPHPPPPTSAQFVTTGAPTTTISWREPAAQVSAITTAHIRLCKGTVCRTTTQPAGTGTGQATLQLDQGPGSYTASVALADAAGNYEPTYATHWSITRTADPTTTEPRSGPPPATTLSSPRLTLTKPAVARDRRSVTVRGTVAPTVRGRVTVTLRVRAGGRMRTIIARPTIRDGRYRARLRIPSRTWRKATITVRYAGSATHRQATATRTATPVRRS